MKVAIRLDVSTEIGTGHAKRMSAVAHALRENGAEIWFIHRQLDLDAGSFLDLDDAAILSLAPPEAAFTPDPLVPHSHWARVPQERDAEETCAALRGQDFDAVIVDHYAFDARWHDAVRDRLGVPLMVIDDLADRRLSGEWLVDHNFHPDHGAKYAGLTPASMHMLAGPAFAMLGPIYAGAPRYEMHDQVGSIGVFMGGVDACGANFTVLDAFDSIGWEGPVEIVSTSANPALDRLRARIANRAGTSLALDLPNLAEFFARHDLQIGAGGGAIWERCCIGPPTVCMVCADNQRLSVPFLDAAGVVLGYDPGDGATPPQVSLAQTIECAIGDASKRRAMNRAATALVDGKGAMRIAQALFGSA
ncbi:UDP-2,4-diacetamido-2,4,6-trideoxy-beta-L-altropyranose hydrolase [Citromicrobium sp. JLT1363]|uniref:UDP-2,4-diacetamido-2,4, 6-trideoxy-beta-L-altropyranose hydrolase n=1 Tax=Citromicrobium sp. JLT1363 TaxID=517722 RepID=UPI000225EB53|nr:UDP-2,4-diacetamido-2,4,6-trideoxy-beta-L-altropyranose hydrolase [Citromicrobium sp. JLT1363]